MSERWSALSELLDRLFELDDAAQQVELARIEAGDPALAEEARALLRADAADGLLERGIAAAAPDIIASLASSAAPDARLGEDLDGLVIGRWRVLRELGRGGMGEVLLAERADGEFEQQAALKRLKRGMDSDEILRRFVQERRILASLEHPNIARLLDGGVAADGRPYFAMEYVEGEPITAYAQANALDVRQRLQLMRQVCEAVAYAQSRLVVHRDLKPSNILVDGRGEPRLLDFGIAKLLADSAAPALTETGARVLSPAYAAPEQMLGEPVSMATDVYALGVLLYELLTGQLPHRRSGAVSDVSAEALARETVELPSALLRACSDDEAARAYGRRVPERPRFARELAGDLDRIVLMALRHEPARRYSSAGRLADDLRLYLEGRPITARRDSASYRMSKFLRRNRVGVVATVLVLSALVIGLGVALWQAELARASAERAEREASRAGKVKDFVVSLFQASNPERTSRGEPMSALELVRQASTRVEGELGDAPQAQAELRIAIGESLVALGEVNSGVSLIEAGVEQLRTVAGAEHVLAKGLHALAMQQHARGQLDKAEQLAQEALTLLEAGQPRDALAIISLQTTQAKLAGLRGDFDAMEALYTRNLEERRALVGADDPRLAVDWNNLAALALRRDRYLEADAGYAEAMRLLQRDPQSPASRLVWLRGGRGVALIGLGRYPQAQAELEAARQLAERSLHAGHPIVGSMLIALAVLHRHQGDFDTSARLATAARDVFAPINHPDQPLAELQVGLTALMQARVADALTVLSQAEQHFRARRNREEPHYWQLQAALALAHLRAGSAPPDAPTFDPVQVVDAALDAMRSRGYAPGMVYADTLGLAAAIAAHRGDAAAETAMLIDQRAQVLQLGGAEHPRLKTIDARLAAISTP